MSAAAYSERHWPDPPWRSRYTLQQFKATLATFPVQHQHGLLYDVDTFQRLMKFIILTYTLTIVIYLLFPTCQELRPERFPRDNLLTRFLVPFYQFDTNTNVCPSLHVIGSLAVLFTAWNTRGLTSRSCRILFTCCAVLICLSTVFLKQHSLLDVIAAIPICFLGWLLCFRQPSISTNGT